jgi:hypothetical protein
MTIYHDKNRRGREPTDTPIVASYNTNEHKTLVCRWCNYTLHTIRDSSGQNVNLYCSNCSISYEDSNTDDLRSESKLEVPDGMDNNRNPAVSYTPESTLKRKKKELTGSFKALQQRGVRFTNITEGKG